MPKRPVRYEKQKKARERALKERKALSYEDVPLEPVSYTHLDVYKRQVRSL